MVSEFSAKNVSLSAADSVGCGCTANLGFSRCVTVNKTPSRIHMPPTTTYAMPKKGLRPPITVRVLIMTDLVPLYTAAGNPTLHGQLSNATGFARA